LTLTRFDELCPIAEPTFDIDSNIEGVHTPLYAGSDSDSDQNNSPIPSNMEDENVDFNQQGANIDQNIDQRQGDLPSQVPSRVSQVPSDLPDESTQLSTNLYIQIDIDGRAVSSKELITSVFVTNTP
jgi:hypothetical protein